MIPITILISLHNAAHDWSACWDSIRVQTFVHWECIIIDDGSTDETPALIRAAAQQDQRVRVLTNERNIGLTASLNRGLKMAQGAYIARLDADDRSISRRLERQYAYVEEHPSVGVLGSAYEEMRISGPRPVTPPLTHTGIVWQMGFQNALMHPAVLMRRDLVEQVGGYDERLRYAQDYDLWERLIGKTRFANLNSVLLNYAVHPDQISRAKQVEQQKIADAVSQRRLQTILGEPLPLDTVQKLRTWFVQLPTDATRDTWQTLGLYFRLLDLLKQDNSLDAAELGRIRRYWHTRIARLKPAWSDLQAAGWAWADRLGVALRLVQQRVRP